MREQRGMARGRSLVLRHVHQEFGQRGPPVRCRVQMMNGNDNDGTPLSAHEGPRVCAAERSDDLTGKIPGPRQEPNLKS